jgi:hypothetical protein
MMMEERLSMAWTTFMPVPESTRRAHAGDWGRFTRWCADAGRDPLTARPARTEKS